MGVGKRHGEEEGPRCLDVQRPTLEWAAESCLQWHTETQVCRQKGKSSGGRMQRGVGDQVSALEGRKGAAVASWLQRRGGAMDLGVCRELSWPDLAVRRWKRPPGGVEGAGWGAGHTSAPRGALQFSSSREAFPQQAQDARGKDSGVPSEGWAWRPGETSGASFGCSRLAQRPQGHMQAKSPLVTASPKDMQTPRPANGR